MKIKDRIKLVAKNLTVGQIPGASGSVLRNYVKGSTFRPNDQLKGITYKAIDKIGLSLSVYEPQVLKPDGDVFINHPLNNVFRKPNPRQNSSDFVHLWAMLYEIYGETFWYKAKGESSGKVKELYLLNPMQVELVIVEGEVIGYKLHKTNGQIVPFEADEIYHDKRPNPFNEYRGMSVMERASVYIDTEITTSNFTLNYMQNNASPSGIVTLPNMTKEAFKLFTLQWRENYEGADNAGKTAFIRGDGVDFKAVGATLKDIDQKVTREMSKDDVLAMFDIPKGLLGMSGDKGLGRSEMEALEYTFAKHKLEPMMVRLDRILEDLAPEMITSVDQIEVTHVSPIPEDKEFYHKVHVDLVNKALTVNEVRQEMGFEPLPGYDEIKQPVIQPPVQAQDKSVKVQLKKAIPKSEIEKSLKDEQEIFRSKLVRTNDIYVLKLKKAMSGFLNEQRDTVIGNINATSKAYEEWLFGVKEESEKLSEIAIPIILELMEAQGEDVAHFITGEEFVITREVRDVVATHIKQISGVFNTDTLKALEETITAGQADGESLYKIKKRVEQVYTDAKGYRAERIARTESLRISNQTAEQVYKQNGYSKVEWFVNPGACEFCLTYAGTVKEIGSTFTNIGDVITGQDGGQLKIEYSNIDTPPLHPNCTCSLIPTE